MLKLNPQNKRFYAWNRPRLHIRLLSSKKTLSTFVLLYFPLGFIRVKWDAVMCCSTEIQLIMRFLLPIMLLSYKFYSVCGKFLNVSFVMPRICARNEIYYEAILKIWTEFTFNYIYTYLQYPIEDKQNFLVSNRAVPYFLWMCSKPQTCNISLICIRLWED